jgi:hypothetical protein
MEDYSITDVIREVRETVDPRGGIKLYHIYTKGCNLSSFELMNWYNERSLMVFVEKLLAQGYLYDDAHISFSRRVYDLNSEHHFDKETYQFQDQYRYEQAKTHLNL